MGKIERSKEQSKTKTARPITAAFIRVGESKLPEHWRKKLGLRPGATWFDGVAAGVFRAAVGGDVAAARELREAIEGKAPLHVELTGKEGGPIAIGDALKKLFEKIAA
jgi:hypothetical protein